MTQRSLEKKAHELLAILGIHSEDTHGLMKLVHPLCQACIGKPCLEDGKCPFEFTQSQIDEVDILTEA